MHYNLLDLGREIDSHRLYSLAECEAFARENGPGTYAVVATSRRLGMDHESWEWGTIEHRPDGSIERLKYAEAE